MLFGPWKEAKPAQGDWIVELPEDNPDGISSLLSIVHAQFTDTAVPNNISADLLYNILVVADKYDMVQKIRPWADTWVRALKGRELSSLTPVGCLVRIHTAWELGCEAVFTEGINHFVFNLGYNGRSFTYVESSSSGYELYAPKLDGYGPFDLKG